MGRWAGPRQNQRRATVGWTGPQLKVAKYACHHLLYLTLVTHVQFVRRFPIRYSLAGRNGDGDEFESGVQPSTAMESIGRSCWTERLPLLQHLDIHGAPSGYGIGTPEVRARTAFVPVHPSHPSQKSSHPGDKTRAPAPLLNSRKQLHRADQKTKASSFLKSNLRPKALSVDI